MYSAGSWQRMGNRNAAAAPRRASPRLPQSPCVRRVTVIISTTERFIDLLCHFPDEKDKYVATPAMCVFADMYQQPTAQMDRLRARAHNVHLLLYTYLLLPTCNDGNGIVVGSRDESPPFLPGRTTNEQSTIGYYVYLPLP